MPFPSHFPTLSISRKRRKQFREREREEERIQRKTPIGEKQTKPNSRTCFKMQINQTRREIKANNLREVPFPSHFPTLSISRKRRKQFREREREEERIQRKTPIGEKQTKPNSRTCFKMQINQTRREIKANNLREVPFPSHFSTLSISRKEEKNSERGREEERIQRKTPIREKQTKPNNRTCFKMQINQIKQEEKTKQTVK